MLQGERDTDQDDKRGADLEIVANALAGGRYGLVTLRERNAIPISVEGLLQLVERQRSRMGDHGAPWRIARFHGLHVRELLEAALNCHHAISAVHAADRGVHHILIGHVTAFLLMRVTGDGKASS